MTQPEQEAREMLAACPFCGNPLFIRKGCNAYGLCETEDCWMRERKATVPLYDPTQVAAWNTRHPPLAPEAGEPDWYTMPKFDEAAFVARPTAGIDREVVRKLLDNLRYKLGHVQIARQNGDNLAVALCSHFEDDSYDCEEEEDENGWTTSASAGCDKMLAAIHALYADAILALRPTPAKTGERGAIIEECARVVAAITNPHDEHRFCGEHAAFNQAIELAEYNIRALSQPLPDAPIVGGEE